MKTTVFAKVRTTAEGKKITNFLCRLKKKDGTEESVQMKLKNECPVTLRAEQCPCIIEVDKENASLQVKHYTDNTTGELKESRVLWVTDFRFSDEVWRDTSLDEYEV